MNESVCIGQVNDFPLQLGKKVEAGGHMLAVFKLSDGTFRAVANSCPAKQGPLSAGMVSGHHLFCPLHDEKINLDTGSVEAPDTGQFRTFKVLVNEEHVFVVI